jgi:hypothetical protein
MWRRRLFLLKLNSTGSTPAMSQTKAAMRRLDVLVGVVPVLLRNPDLGSVVM